MISRQAAAIALAALLLCGAGVAAAISHDDGDRGATAAPTLSTVGPSTTTDPPQPTSTAGITSTTAGVTATTAARSTTTARPATTTTSTTALGTPDCTAAQIDVSVTTDQRSYATGQQVKVDSRLRNRSQTTCFYAGHTFQVAIQDAVGRPIITFEIATPGTTKSPFVPGATLTGSVPWDQRSCQTQPCRQPPPGPYVAAVKWIFAGGPYEARAPFSLTP